MSIQSEINRIAGARDDAFDAIEDKGVTVPQGSTIDDMADLIAQISGGGGSAYAVISVTYPSGSTCTCTKGSTVLTAEGTSGLYNFLVPEAGSWTVSCTNGTDSDSKTASITAQYENVDVELVYIPAVVNNATWTQISEVSIAGTGDTYWDVGDCKAVTLNGKIGSYLTLSNTTLYVFILDFNHPINKTTADNNIIWGGFKTALTGGKDVSLCDSGYGNNYTSGKYFNINHVGSSSSPYSTNYGGWRGCDFRYDILGGTSTKPSPYNTTKTTSTTGSNATQATINTPVANTLMAALPSDLRAALRLWNRYVDYKGNSSNADANCSTATVDALSLLAEFEIYGSRKYSNLYEQNHQKQMAYYTAGNSKIKYKHNATGTASIWWESSPDSTTASYFCYVNYNGNAEQDFGSRTSVGLAPAFRT